eukprot:CAMPEP_0170565830 /NCGR_PEP_ID=MMETSP0211-20121228/79436_1 /TAXON_ID=311385 /ORGANISM="Pseudokeronopsis sp., Strain OXSARD2" /LENGTH=131 /DNA_ID=CAMNT_0010886811 /DNA_START=1067 /DNA_END=1462 /DNA_ORIENTATION=-
MYLALQDKYGYIVGNDISSQITVRVDITFNEYDEQSLVYDPVLTGNSSFSAIGGVFSVGGISFTGSPGYNYKIIFETDGIDTQKVSNQEYIASKGDLETKTNFFTFINLRECEVGEAFLDSGRCQMCLNGT